MNPSAFTTMIINMEGLTFLFPLLCFFGTALGKFAEPKIEELLDVLQNNPVVIWNLR